MWVSVASSIIVSYVVVTFVATVALVCACILAKQCDQNMSESFARQLDAD